MLDEFDAAWKLAGTCRALHIDRIYEIYSTIAAGVMMPFRDAEPT